MHEFSKSAGKLTITLRTEIDRGRGEICPYVDTAAQRRETHRRQDKDCTKTRHRKTLRQVKIAQKRNPKYYELTAQLNRRNIK